MVKQYPDTILITSDPAFTQDSKGYFESSGAGGTFTSGCRAEPAGSNPVIKGEDGNDLVYSWIVYLPKTSEAFAFGAGVTLTLADGSIHKSSLKRSSNGQFNTRLWV